MGFQKEWIRERADSPPKKKKSDFIKELHGCLGIIADRCATKFKEQKMTTKIELQ